MNYKFMPDNFYRMPTHFGPSLGPRQGVENRRYSNTDFPNDTSLQASFSADPEQIRRLLPPGFSLRAPYVVNLGFSYITNITWLAGRGYNTFSVSVPATYQGSEETVHGELLLVIWENHADPIITGREELGYAKIFCDIPPLQHIDERIICRASWDGFEFASIDFGNLHEIAADQLPSDPDDSKVSAGLLHYKYIPKTGCPGEADVAYATLTPAAWPNIKIENALLAETAKVTFNRGTWEQLPTLVNIVDTLASLTLGSCQSASLVNMRGGKDISDQRILR